MASAKFNKSPIRKLNVYDFTFDGQIKHRDFVGKTGVIVFYMPGCIHCKMMEEEFTKAAQQAVGVIPFGAIDGTDRKNLRLLERFGIRSFPTVRLIINGTMSSNDFKGGRTAPSFVHFACTRISKDQRNNNRNLC